MNPSLSKKTYRRIRYLAQVLLVLVASSGLNSIALAAEYYTLYGYKIGQPIAFAQKALGKPFKVHKYEDGWTSYSYRLKDHNVYFETSKESPNTIISIQIEGLTNPAHFGLDSINLGDDAIKALNILGTPKQTRKSVDVATKKAVADTIIHYYDGYSFEEKAGKVTSIKVILYRIKEIEGNPDFKTFFKSVKSKDYYRLAEMTSAYAKYKGKKFIKGPMLEEIKDGRFAKIFYDSRGNQILRYRDVSLGHMRISRRMLGHVLQFKNKPINELVFYHSYEGWVLAEIW